MYGFRKPFTAGTFLENPGETAWKTYLVTAQVLGYTISKFIRIRVIAEMSTERRAPVLLSLIGFAQLALLLFAIVPAPYHVGCMFLNGLPLGMVFGLVLGFIEGRRATEAFVAGLCTSFILADGVTKSVGAWLIQIGIPERWMPFCAGLVFIMPLFLFVEMLRRIPGPTVNDLASRSERVPMTKSERLNVLKRHGIGLGLISFAYLLITVLRSIRADFAPEIWAALGTTGRPAMFTTSEVYVALGVLVLNGAIVMVRNNRTAFFVSIGLCLSGLAMAGLAIWGWEAKTLDGFDFMVLLGLWDVCALRGGAHERIRAFDCAYTRAGEPWIYDVHRGCLRVLGIRCSNFGK